jgi:hypothetical protein
MRKEVFFGFAVLVGSVAACTRADRGPSAMESGTAAPGPVAASGATEGLLASTSASCLACAREKQCVVKGKGCEDMEGSADAGPASGKGRSQLCLDTLSCVLSTKCASVGAASPCFCGTALPGQCFGDAGPNGPCIKQEQAGMETNDTKNIAVGWLKGETGGARANYLVQCLINNHCNGCF